MLVSMLTSKVGSYPNIHKASGAGITIAQTLPEPQAYARHVPDQVIIAECATPPLHSSYKAHIYILVLR